MNRRSIQRMIRSVLRRRGGTALAALPQKLQEHGRTGELPADPLARSYIELNTAALVVMDQSIGGAGHEAACREYEQRLADWQRALREAGI